MARIIQPACLCLIALCSATATAALPPVLTDRPLATPDAHCVPAGTLQNELSYTHARRDGTTVDRVGEWLFRWGVVRDFETRLMIGSAAWVEDAAGERSHGWTDSWLGLKWTSQHGHGPKPTAALLLGTSLPTGGEVFRENTLQPSVDIGMAWALGGGVQLAAGVGYAWASHDLDRFDRWRGSLAVTAALGGGIGLFAEGRGYLSETPGGDETGYLAAGVTGRVIPDVTLDLRAELGCNGCDEEWLLAAGLTWRTDGP